MNNLSKEEKTMTDMQPFNSVSEFLIELSKHSTDLGRSTIIDIGKLCSFWDDIKMSFYLAYHPTISFGIEKIPPFEPQECESLSVGLERIKQLADRQYTGNAAISFLADILSKSVDPDVLIRVIKRDMKCGIAAKEFSKLSGHNFNFRTSPPPCKAYEDISGIVYPAFGQIKYDGARCQMTKIDGKIVAFSANDNICQKFDIVFAKLADYLDDGQWLDGEIVFMNKDAMMDRKASNGLFNKSVRGTITDIEANLAMFFIWDLHDNGVSKTPYRERIEQMKKFGGLLPNVKVVDTFTVSSEDQAFQHFKHEVLKGNEGIILKNMEFVWEPKRVRAMGKLKEIYDADLVVIDTIPGEIGSKYESMIGKLVASTKQDEAEIIVANVGTGLSDVDRSLGKDYWVGKIVTVSYNKIITNKNTSSKTLFLTRLIEVRYDKDEPNCAHELNG